MDRPCHGGADLDSHRLQREADVKEESVFPHLLSHLF